MESLALLAAAIVLLLVGLSVAALGLSLAGFRTAGAGAGVVALASLAWFAWNAPQVWAFYVPLAAAAAWAVARNCRKATA